MSDHGKYGLPLDVKFCKKCTISNQRPSSTVEFRNKKNQNKETISFDESGICDACRYMEIKKTINWAHREEELRLLCDRFRRNDGRYDVIVPGSGGKDSLYVAHLLKYKYNMHPLLVTWPPHMYTENGFYNFLKWLEAGFPNITYWPDQKVHKIVTRLAFKNLLHPFQPFIVGQRNIGPMFSTLLDIPLIMYGENQAEYGNKIKENKSPQMKSIFFSSDSQLNEIMLGGVSIAEIIETYGLSLSDLKAYIPTSSDLLDKCGTEVHYMSYYVNWHPQEVYYYAITNTGFRPNTKRTEGSYSKYSSIDDKLDWLHYYTTYIKFGIGRATYDSSQEIRNGDITRDEGVYLVNRFDGEMPKEYLQDILNYLEMSYVEFERIIDEGRPEHLWVKKNGDWTLKHKVTF